MNVTLPKKIIDDSYSFESNYDSGWQSTTTIVSKEGTKYLLKRPLKKEISSEQKFRFQQEAKALELIDGNWTPKVYDFSFEDDEPFILMEYIEGKTLWQVVNGRALGIDTSIGITFKILDILWRIHEIGLLHRDIKPDNIIIHDNWDVTLIDFGLCRIDDPDRTFTTPQWTELGNRFLRLPELGKGEKIPSSVSDITFVVGLLFYMLSWKQPHQLLDEYTKSPQKRNLLSPEIEKIDWLMYTFDKGFVVDISQRFQSTEDLRSFITEQKNIEKNMQNDNPAEDFSKLINTDDFKRKDVIINLLVDAHKEFLLNVRNTLNSDIQTWWSWPNIQSDWYIVVTNFFLVRSGYSEPKSNYDLISILKKDLSVISFNAHVNGVIIKNGTFNSSEHTRITNEHKEIGNDIWKMAVRDLLEMIKRK
jgi:serine/threonine protein kinase